MAARRAIVHVGTHKTGTKSIQSSFIDNFASLRAAGCYVVQTGRIEFSQDAGTPGQHGLVLALRTGDAKVLGRLSDEVRAANAQSIFISSEEFHPMVAVPEDLRHLRDLLASLGYTATIVIYLRPQDEYAQSMYAELTKGGHDVSRRFNAFLSEILTHNALFHDSASPMIFKYSEILEPFAAIFGESNIVVRRYDDSGDPSLLLRDFARVTSSVTGVNIEQLAVVDPHLNRRGTFAGVLANLYSMATKIDPAALSPYALAGKLGIAATDTRLSEPFNALLQSEARAFAAHFSADNAIVEAMSGVTLRIETENRNWDGAAFQRAFLDFAGDVWFR